MQSEVITLEANMSGFADDFKVTDGSIHFDLITQVIEV